MDNIKNRFQTNLELQQDIGNKLRKLRLKRNMPRQVLADEAGISIGSVVQAEAGKDIRLSTLLSILRVLGGLDRAVNLIPSITLSPLEIIDHGKERLKARRFGKKG